MEPEYIEIEYARIGCEKRRYSLNVETGVWWNAPMNMDIWSRTLTSVVCDLNESEEFRFALREYKLKKYCKKDY